MVKKQMSLKYLCSTRHWCCSFKCQIHCRCLRTRKLLVVWSNQSARGPSFHRGCQGFTRQPENSKRAHFRVPVFKNTTKYSLPEGRKAQILRGVDTLALHTAASCAIALTGVMGFAPPSWSDLALGARPPPREAANGEVGNTKASSRWNGGTGASYCSLSWPRWARP